MRRRFGLTCNAWRRHLECHRADPWSLGGRVLPGRPKARSTLSGGGEPHTVGDRGGHVSMIYGIGTDICDVRRIRDSLSRHGDRFAAKILSDGEFTTWQARSKRWPERGVRYLATRFSAKEAFSKAIGLGMRMPMTWRLCEIAKLPSGAPTIVLHSGLKEWFAARKLSAHISVTDETDYAASFCVVEFDQESQPK